MLHEALGRWKKNVKGGGGVDPATFGSGVELATNEAIATFVFLLVKRELYR